ncbi:MAG: hypothetical protein WKG00_12240, partial [Polyangiaceae bacterium]
MKRRDKAQYLAITLVALAASIACGKKGSDSGDAPDPASLIADTGFRPNKHGFPFKNTGGNFPRTPGLVDANVMTKLFGKEACVGGNAARCKLTPPATEWMGMINRAMNGGQCEGMAVSSLTFFQNIDSPAKHSPTAKSAHDLQHRQVSPLIGYYWAWQAVDPMMRETVLERRRTAPADVVDRLAQMMKQNQMATIAIWAPRPQRGGHAVTPYAIENKGNNEYWVRIYDNNYPDTERYIVIDKNANTWRYDVAALNPSVPKMPWYGDAESRSIAILPVATRLKKADCPFCKTTKGKTVVPRGAALNISDPDGKKLGYDDGGKLINEIPGADVVDLTAFLEDAEAPEPIFILPDDDKDYEITVADPKVKAKPAEGDDDDTDDNASVAIFSGGTAIAVGKSQRDAGQKDTISLSKDGFRYRTANGKVPKLRLALDDDKEGVAVGVKNMKADADDEVELKMDRKSGRVTVQGGGKSTDSYDLKIKKVKEDGDDDEVEAKGVKFKLGDSHSINVRAPMKPHAKGAPAAAPAIEKGKFVPRLKPKPQKADPEHDDKNPGDDRK